jgi:single-strand DNA-binding protein
MNQVTLIGRITKDLQIEAAGQHKVLRFSVAINNGKDKEATFINCQAWNKTAELIGQYFTKGSRIGILGRLDVSKYEKDGRTITNTYVTVNSIEFIDTKSDKPKEVHEVVDVEFDYGPTLEIDSDSLPF